MKTVLVFLGLFAMGLAIGITKAKHPERQIFQPWYKCEEAAPTPSPTPAADIGTPAPVAPKEEETIAFERKATWEELSAIATPIYERCVKRARKSKKQCAVDECGDAYYEAVWPDQDRHGYSNYSYCMTQAKERAERLKCVRKALRVEDPAERIVSMKECGV